MTGKSINQNAIPSCLKSLDQWVLWKLEGRGNNLTKIPYLTNGKQAKSDDSSSWKTFKETVAELSRFSGIGFVFSADDPYCGIDLDNCRDPKTGRISGWAKEIILRVDTYAEVSPSGRGVKLWIIGKSPLERGRRVFVEDAEVIGDKKPAVEVYDSLRYFAMTGWRLTGPKEPQSRQQQLDDLCAKYFPVDERSKGGDWYSEPFVIERARKYIAKKPPAISGQHGHDPTFGVACVLVLGFCLGENDAMILIREYSERCNPPWSEKELLHKIRSANKQPGPRGYLRNAAPNRWESIAVPEYKEPVRQQQQSVKREPRVTTLADAAKAYLDSIRHGQTPLVETGIPDLDYALGGGVEKGELIIFAARPSHAKAQPLESNVLTPFGFVAMGDLEVGSIITAASGKPTCVTGIHEQGEVDVFRVKLSDGTCCECTEDHLWFTRTRTERRRGSQGSVKTLKEIMSTMRRQDGGLRNHAVPLVGPVEFCPFGELLIRPYLMGLLLGDGSFRSGCVTFNKPERDIHERLRGLLPATDVAVDADSRGTLRIRRKQRNNERSETSMAIDYYGLGNLLSREKFIPLPYMTASVSDRIELMRGLFDTDGHVVKEGGTVEFGTSSIRLFEQVVHLVRGLGGIVSSSTSCVPAYTHREERKEGFLAHRMLAKFPGGIVPVSSRKHLERWNPGRLIHRSITSAELIGRKKCRCITIEDKDQLYVTDNYVVTHNSATALQCVHHWTSQGMPCAIVSEEMSAIALGKRTVQFVSTAPQEHWYELMPHLDADVEEYARTHAKCIVLEGCGDTTTVVEAIESAIEKEKVQCVVVDYAQLLRGQGKSRYEQMTSVSIVLRQLASKHKIILLALCQMSREVENRTDFKPTLRDIKESGQFEQDADVIVFLLWPWRINPSEPQDRYQFFVEKNRNRAINRRIVDCSFNPVRQMISMLGIESPFGDSPLPD